MNAKTGDRLCLGMSVQKQAELLKLLEEEYGIVPQEDFLSEEECRKQAVRTKVASGRENFLFSKYENKKSGRVNNTPFNFRKRTYRKR